MTEFSSAEVLARWAYSEINDGTLAGGYDRMDGVNALRERHRSGISIEELSDGERYCLAYMCICARPVPWFYYMSPIRSFRVCLVGKAELAEFFVMPQVAYEELKGQKEPFKVFVGRPRPPSPKDCRNVEQPTNGYRDPETPLVLGVCGGEPILIDGYHRAVMFWKWALEDQKIAVFVPAA